MLRSRFKYLLFETLTLVSFTYAYHGFSSGAKNLSVLLSGRWIPHSPWIWSII